MNKLKNGSNPFTVKDIRGIITEENEVSSEHLDNLDNENRAQKTVQMTRELTTSNGCHVTLMFPPVSRSGVHRRIAEMFLAAMEKGKEEA